MKTQGYVGARVEVWAWAGERGIRAVAHVAGGSASVTSQALALAPGDPGIVLGRRCQSGVGTDREGPPGGGVDRSGVDRAEGDRAHGGTGRVVPDGEAVVRSVPVGELVATVIGLLPPDQAVRAAGPAANLVIAVAGRVDRPVWVGAWVGCGELANGSGGPTHDHGRGEERGLEAIGQALVWALTAEMAA